MDRQAKPAKSVESDPKQTSAVHLKRDGFIAVRRTQAMSTDSWKFPGDGVTFLQGGQRPRRVTHARPCLPNSILKPSAGAD
jgi:hypothetical protein